MKNTAKQKANAAKPLPIYFEYAQKGKAKTIADVVKGGTVDAPGMTPSGRAVEGDYYSRLQRREMNSPPTAKDIAGEIEASMTQPQPTNEQIMANGGGIAGFRKALRQMIAIRDKSGTGPQ